MILSDDDDFFEKLIETNAFTSHDVKKDIQREFEELNKIQLNTTSLEQIIVDDLDPEQIWAQLDASIKSFGKSTIKIIETLQTEKSRTKILTDEAVRQLQKAQAEGVNEKTNDDNDEIDSDDGARSNDSESNESYENDQILSEKTGSYRQLRRSIVDDKFFHLAEMQQFQDLNDENAIFDLNDKDGEDIGAMYQDFFDAPDEATITVPSLEQKQTQLEPYCNDDKPIESPKETNKDDIDRRSDDDEQTGKFMGDAWDSDENVNEKQKSEFEDRQNRFADHIEKLHEENLADRSWQFTGEVTAQHRPLDSALHEDLIFDQTQRLPPVITEDYTSGIESIIKQRIKDKIFDDVLRKVKPSITPHQYRAKLELDSAKSKKSLAQIYEDEYNKLTNPDTQDKENPAHVEIERDMGALFTTLDALSNYYYSPHVADPTIRLIVNTKASKNKEISAIRHCNEDTLAPEQIVTPAISAPKAIDERTSTDKKRARRLKKKAQHEKSKLNECNELEEKAKKRIKNVSGNKRKIANSSTKLFTTLQKEAKDNINKLALRSKYSKEGIPTQKLKPVTAPPKKKKRR